MEPIRGKVEIIDPSYRYKMHKLNLQKEATKTCIVNLDEIASDINIPDSNLIITFIKKKLSIAIVKDKTNRVIISNDVESKNILNALYDFIEYFVLCKKCRLPELDYKYDKKHLEVYCKSCGHVDNITSDKNTDSVIKQMEIQGVVTNKGNKNKIKKDNL